MRPRTILITGAARGIGAAAARLFGRPGYRVALHYWDDEPAAMQLAESLRAGGVASVAAYRADLGSIEAVHGLFRAVCADWEGVDVLVNNAAADIHSRRSFPTITPTLWDQVMRVNVQAPFILSQLAAPRMIERRWGRIINIVSVNWQVAHSINAAYVTSKAALVGQTRALARELGPLGVTVNAVSPGDIRTESAREAFGDTSTPEESLQLGQCIPRVGTAEEVAHAIFFLASDGAAFITGSILPVDGGWAMT